MIIKGFNVVPLVKKTVKEIGEDRIPSLAAETAYYFFFSLFPLLLFLTPLLGLVGNGQQLMTSLLDRLSATMPADALSLLRRVLREIITTSGGAGVMSVGALLAAWSGSMWRTTSARPDRGGRSRRCGSACFSLPVRSSSLPPRSSSTASVSRSGRAPHCSWAPPQRPRGPSCR
jgi:hypothetical protein